MIVVSPGFVIRRESGSDGDFSRSPILASAELHAGYQSMKLNLKTAESNFMHFSPLTDELISELSLFCVRPYATTTTA
jgi:hypothetical protein